MTHALTSLSPLLSTEQLCVMTMSVIASHIASHSLLQICKCSTCLCDHPLIAKTVLKRRSSLNGCNRKRLLPVNHGYLMCFQMVAAMRVHPALQEIQGGRLCGISCWVSGCGRSGSARSGTSRSRSARNCRHERLEMFGWKGER